MAEDEVNLVRYRPQVIDDLELARRIGFLPLSPRGGERRGLAPRTRPTKFTPIHVSLQAWTLKARPFRPRRRRHGLTAYHLCLIAGVLCGLHQCCQSWLSSPVQPDLLSSAAGRTRRLPRRQALLRCHDRDPLQPDHRDLSSWRRQLIPPPSQSKRRNRVRWSWPASSATAWLHIRWSRSPPGRWRYLTQA